MQDLGFHNLGFINVAVVYLSGSFNSLFTIKLVTTIGARRAMQFGGSMVVLWMAAFLLPAFRSENKQTTGIFSNEVIIFFSIFTSFTLGIGGAALWVSHGFYMSECASHKTKGRYFSIFFSIFNGSQIVSYFLAGFMI